MSFSLMRPDAAKRCELLACNTHKFSMHIIDGSYVFRNAQVSCAAYVSEFYQFLRQRIRTLGECEIKTLLTVKEGKEKEVRLNMVRICFREIYRFINVRNSFAVSETANCMQIGHLECTVAKRQNHFIQM